MKIYRSCLFYSLILFSIFAVGQANAYSVYGEILASAYGGDMIKRSTIGGTATALADSGSSWGNGGAVARSAYFADLSTGLLGTYNSGDNPNAAEISRAAAHAESKVYFRDIIEVDIPAGTYASDLYISLNGFVNGVITAFGCSDDGRCSNAYETYYFQLGGPFGRDEFSASSRDTATYPDNSPNFINENFTLSAKISNAGTYSTDQTISLIVDANLRGKGTALWLYQSTVDKSSYFSADFYNTGGFTSVAVPDGVTWTSESGVFMSAVPVPAAVWLFGSGLLSLMAITKRRKNT